MKKEDLSQKIKIMRKSREGILSGISENLGPEGKGERVS